MIKFVNGEGKVVMTESDTGKLVIIDEQLKTEMKSQHTEQKDEPEEEERAD